MAKLRRDLEEANLNHETQLGALRKKHNDAVAELSDQLDQLQKQRQKAEKDKTQIQREMEDLQSQVDQEASGRMNNEKLSKQYELQLNELQTKCDEQTRQLQDFASLKARFLNENGDLGRQLEDAESQVKNLKYFKNLYQIFSLTICLVSKPNWPVNWKKRDELRTKKRESVKLLLHNLKITNTIRINCENKLKMKWNRRTKFCVN